MKEVPKIVKKSKAKAQGAAALRTCAFTFSLLLLAALLPIVQADATSQQYTIPLLGGRWSTFAITVKIPAEPKWAHDAVIDALSIWTDAQVWFNREWQDTQSIYRLSPSDRGSVAIHFIEDRTEIVKYCGKMIGGCGGPTRLDAGNNIREGAVYINMQDIQSISEFTFLLTHELGHVLGLGHTQEERDIMCGAPWICRYQGPPWGFAYPSTLDLFALYNLLTGKIPKSVTLPNSIPFGPPEATLEIELPPIATIRVDSQEQVGSHRFTVTWGEHTISISAIVPIDNSTRLIFNFWSDGLGQLVRGLSVRRDMTLKANYVTQFLLQVNGQHCGTKGSGWYTQGTTAVFSVVSVAPRMEGVLGLLGGEWKFRGWYENGKPLAYGGSSSVDMNEPHSVSAEWDANYLVPGVLLSFVMAALSALALVSVRKRKVRTTL